MTVRIKSLPVIYAYAEGSDDEHERLAELSEMLLLDELSEDRIDGCTKLLAETLGCHIAFTHLADGEKHWFHCVTGGEFSDFERDLCLLIQSNYADQLFVVDKVDSDPLLADHPAVRGQRGVRFCAGAALHGSNGNVIGACCVVDYRDRHLSAREVKFLAQTIKLIERELQDQEIVVELRENIRSQALRDPVTELPNLSSFQASLDRCLHCQASVDGQHLIVAIRLSRYDMLENAIGRFGMAYLIGDAVKRIRSRLGADTLIGQVREDELAVARPCKSPNLQCTELLNDIVACFEDPYSLGDETFFLSVEVGASRYPEDAASPAELLRKARIALRSSNISESSKYRLYDQSLAAQSDSEFRLESALTRGVSRGEFHLVYQPIVSLSTNKITGAEALMRWTSPEIGEIAPDVFIPIAERIGVLHEIGIFAATSVCKQLSQWRLSGKEHLDASFNLSGSQLYDPLFFDRMVQLIEQNDVDGSKLRLEITEGSLIEEPLKAIEVMNRLRKRSISFSIDDFGVGFSSLNYLRMMPLSVLKIDQSFVANIPSDHNDRSIAQAIIALGHSLGLKIVAEGVESFRQLEWLRKHGCDEVQGYVFSEPLDPNKFNELVFRDPTFGINAETG